MGVTETGFEVPPGISWITRFCKKDLGLQEHRILVLLLTFVAYASFHASRKPLSIVKSVLDPEGIQRFSIYAEPPGIFLAPCPSLPPSLPGWPPFNGNLGKARLGEIDVAFLATYAAGMYYAGVLGDRLDLRRFLTFGMVSSGACICLFGLGYWWNIHSFWFYFIIQVLTGLLSSVGWPVVVAVIANWFGKTKRGLIMGIWNAHGSVGNVAGSIVAAAALRFGWGWSFLFPGVALMICALLVFLFLVVQPTSSILLPSCPGNEQTTFTCDEESKVLLEKSQSGFDSNGTPSGHSLPGQVVSDLPVSFEVEGAINGASQSIKEPSYNEHHANKTFQYASQNCAVPFFEAWNIPGVALYAFCLFFVKLVAYTFLYWLPFYIRHTEIGGVYLSVKTAGYLSTIFDIGGVLGGIVAGYLSDKHDAKAIIAVIFMYCAVPSLYLFRSYGGTSLSHAVGLMIVSGMFVNGPYALITTAVSADLGTHNSLKGNARALATVTAIIDGTGSVGAAVGPFLTGYIAATSWTAVFIALALSLCIAGLFLMKLVLLEMKEKIRLYKHLTTNEVQQEEEVCNILVTQIQGDRDGKSSSFCAGIVPGR